jgi:copper chaperone NosL
LLSPLPGVYTQLSKCSGFLVKTVTYYFTADPHLNPPPKVLGEEKIFLPLLRGRLGWRFWLAIFCTLLTLGCQSADTPVPINKDVDMCEYCRMTIGGFHYAAEIIEKRKAHKFDDIGCMLAYAQANKLSPENARFWVMDFDNSTWIKGEEAYFIISPEIHTPMGYGIVAFKDANKAKEVADKNKVEVVELETIFDLYWKPGHEH